METWEDLKVQATSYVTDYPSAARRAIAKPFPEEVVKPEEEEDPVLGLGKAASVTPDPWEVVPAGELPR